MTDYSEIPDEPCGYVPVERYQLIDIESAGATETPMETPKPYVTLHRELDRLLREDLLNKIRRLRAMVLRAHAGSLEQVDWCSSHWIGNRARFEEHARRWNHWAWHLAECANNRAARLLLHWADAIEQGRVR